MKPKISLIFSKDDMLPGGGIRPPRMAVSESYKCNHRYYLSANNKMITILWKEKSEKGEIGFKEQWVHVEQLGLL